MFLHKSMLQIWMQCPLRFKMEFIENRPRQVTYEMQLGSMFHDFARDFFDFVDLKTASRCKSLKEVSSLFGKLVLPEFPPVLKKLCRNFTAFEAARYWTLRERNRLDIYMPVARELTIEDPKTMLAGTIDRIDKMADDTLCIVEYKTGNPQIRSVQRELAFYKILLDAVGIYDEQIKWLAIYNPDRQKFYVRTFSTQLVRATQRRIGQFWRSYQKGIFEAKPGFRCIFCPHKNDCPYIIGGESDESDN